MNDWSYVVTDPEDFPRDFPTLGEAITYYNELLASYTEAATTGSGWHESMDQLRILKVVAETVEFDRRSRPNDLDEDGFSESTGDYWPDSDWEYISSYRRADNPNDLGLEMIVIKCKCSFHSYMVGDGCDECNPAKALDYAYETIEEMRAEIERLRMRLMTGYDLVAESIGSPQYDYKSRARSFVAVARAALESRDE